MTDVTLPAEDARAWASDLRDIARDGGERGLLRLADLLDPPAPSLRDEVAQVITQALAEGQDPDEFVPTVLAVVRRHVEALDALADTNHPHGAYHRPDVLRLLGGDQ